MSPTSGLQPSASRAKSGRRIPIGMCSELRKNGTVLVGVSGTQLADMMAQMRKIIRCKKAKGDGIARADAANSFEFRGRQLRYNVSEVAIVSRP